LRNGDNAALLAKPEQKRAERDQKAQQREHSALVAGGVGDESRRQRGQ
jgi:hypothetical protein